MPVHAGPADSVAQTVLVPDWPVPTQVRAVCTTRAGGQSLPPYDSLNLGDHVGDAPQAVRANRAMLAAQLQARPVFLQQVHGTQVLPLTADTPDATVADACLTALRGVACTIMVADCLPVLFTDVRGRAVAAAHAGWRGLAGGVLEQTCHALRACLQGLNSAPNRPPVPVKSMWDATESVAHDDAAGADILAWLGPCIGPQAFEVGDEVRAAFVAHNAQALALFVPHTPGKWLADLAGLARQRLAAMGVTRVHGNDGSAPWCTVANPSRFFSHRRDRVSGRFAASIWLA